MKNVDNIALPQRGLQVKMGLQFAGVCSTSFGRRGSRKDQKCGSSRSIPMVLANMMNILNIRTTFRILSWYLQTMLWRVLILFKEQTKMPPRTHSLAVISTILCLFDNLTLNETIGTLSKSSPQSSPTMESHVILIEWQYKSLTWNTNNIEELVERRCTTAVVYKHLIESTLRPSKL